MTGDGSKMDNVGIVVYDLPATIAFFQDLGYQRVEIAMMRTPDAHSRLELSRFLAPPVVAHHSAR